MNMYIKEKKSFKISHPNSYFYRVSNVLESEHETHFCSGARNNKTGIFLFRKVPEFSNNNFY